MLRTSSLGAWAAWITATAIAGSLALILSAYFVPVMLPGVYFDDITSITGDNLVPHFIAWAVGLVLFVGPLIGISQGLVLLVFVHHKAWLSWTIHSLLGISIALLILAFIGFRVESILVWALLVPGFVCGLAQWLVLRRLTKQASWWIVICGVGWMVALALSPALTGVLLPSSWQGLPFYPVESIRYFAFAGFITLTIFASITGVALLNPFGRRSEEDT